MEYDLIGGLSDYDTLSSRFLEMKRIGLRHLIADAISNGSNSISLKKACYNKTKYFNRPLFRFVTKREI